MQYKSSFTVFWTIVHQNMHIYVVRVIDCEGNQLYGTAYCIEQPVWEANKAEAEYGMVITEHWSKSEQT